MNQPPAYPANILAPAAITQRYRQNPNSPPAYGGMAERNKDFVEQDFSYPRNITLTALQLAPAQTITIDNDSDFEWRGIQIPVRTGAYEIQFFDAQNNPLSNGYLSYLNFQVATNVPIIFPLTPAVLIPMSGQVKFNIQDLSNATNSIQIVLRGVKRFRYNAS